MFKKEATFEGGSQDTVIAQGVKVEGDFVSQGNIIIEGEVHGTIKTDHDLRIGEQARVVANVWAENAVIAGEVQGNMKVAERLELAPTSRVIGDVEVKTVSMAPGAIFCGRCMMPGGPDVVAATVPERKRNRTKVAAVEAEEPQLM
ncbi:polymer-forming cytoskeletal protein [Candidatus Uhrbacteria bacterium]|nr:polymer-forming cytoskeletal protein [Candidatus Uhrbacteria bacterium]